MVLQLLNRNKSSIPSIMGILNVTPDSFSDGGQFVKPDTARTHVREMINAGAHILDVGGESTRPGAKAISVDEELARVIPMIEMIRTESDIPISIDTSKPQVMREAFNSGASMINDINALQAEGALDMAVELGAPVCLMHMQGEPRTMQQSPQYDDVVGEVKSFLQQRMDACRSAGLSSGNIIIDPGFGFGKTVQHNYSLFKHLDVFTELGVAVLVGVSRKSMIGAVLDDAPANERLFGSVALATLAAWKKTKIIRVHDVKATADALKVCQAVMQAE